MAKDEDYIVVSLCGRSNAGMKVVRSTISYDTSYPIRGKSRVYGAFEVDLDVI